MSFANWEFIQTANATAALTSSSPLMGTNSVQLTTSSAGTNRAQAGQVSAASGITRGISRGKIRTLLRKTAGANVDEFCAGIFCLAESSNFGLGTGGAYYAIVETETGNLSLRYGNNLDPTTSSLLASYALGFSNSTTIALELQWRDSVSLIGGKHFIVRTGTATDYSNLTERINIVDATTRTIAAYEGICHMQDLNTTPVAVWYFDNTEIYTMA